MPDDLTGSRMRGGYTPKSSVVGFVDIAVPAEEWMADALCAQIDADMFYPPKGASTREAKQVCRSCPVVAECLEYALENGERHGVWGAASEWDRRRMARERRKSGQGAA